MMAARSATAAELNTQSGKALHVLTLTPFYPVSGDDAQGCYVAEPLARLEPLGVVNSVIAVRPFYRGRVRPSQTAVPANWSHFFSLPGGFGLPTSGAFLFARLLSQVRRLHRSNAVHIIHAHAALPCGHAALLLSRELGVPFVVTVHGLDAFFTNQVSGYWGKWCERISRMVYRAASQVICISEHVRDQVTRGVAGRVSTTVVYNGVDPHLFAPGDEPTVSNILSVGNLIPIKGHELLLRAFAAIHLRFPEIACEVIGDGPERSHLKALVARLNVASKVHFRGRQSRSQVAAMMRHCTLFALPSRYEGLGCVYLEAMSSEKAVIACRGQGIEDVIQHGTNGWLIDPDDLPALTGALSVLLENLELRRQIGSAARQTVLHGYTLSHQAARLLQVYRECQP